MHECVWRYMVVRVWGVCVHECVGGDTCTCECVYTYASLGWPCVKTTSTYECDFGEHLASLFPMMYPMSRPEGDSITLKYSGHTAR